MLFKYFVTVAVISCCALGSDAQVTVDGCNVTKNCFRDPPGCSIDSPTCRFISWRNSTDGGYDFEMSGGSGDGQQYIAFALGLKEAMETADLYFCDGIAVRSGVIQTLHNPPQYLTMEGGLQTKHASTVNGVGQCILSRPASVVKNISDMEMKDFDITTEEFHLLVAVGPTLLGDRVSKHTWKIVTSTMYDFSMELPQTPVTSDSCGTTKNCFKDPENCDIGDAGCRYYSWRMGDDGLYYFEMSGGTGNGQQYIALALGVTNQMQDADLYYCDGTAVRSGAIQELHNGPAYYEMNGGLATISATTVNGVARCVFSRPASVTKTISGGVSKNFDITKDEYHLLGAIGPMNGTKIQKHNVWRWVTNNTYNFANEIGKTTPPPQTTQSPPPQTEQPISANGCGENKTCYRNPENCEVGNTNCNFYSWMKMEDGTFNFEMVGPGGNEQDYIAFALGTQNKMQDADLYYCDGVTIRSGVIRDLHRPPTYLTMNNGLEMVSATTIDGVAQCVLNRPASVTKEISDGVSKNFDLNEEKYNLLIAHGEMNETRVRKHTWAFATDDKIVSSTGVLRSSLGILHSVLLGLLTLLAINSSK